MDEQRMNRLLMEKVGKKFYGHDKLKSKYKMQIPPSAEREYIRCVNAYMGLLKAELEEEIPKIKAPYITERKVRQDGEIDLILALNEAFNRISNKLTSKTETFGLRHRLENLAHLNRKLTVREWKNAIKRTLGIDIREDYYLGDFFETQIQNWINENIDLIVTIPQDTLGKMRDIVYEDYLNGRTTKDMVKDLRSQYNINLRHARLIARDQTAKLNGQITRFQQEDAGIEYYEWSTSGDERVRESHKKLDGKIFRWSDEPPETDNGRHCFPGTDYQCRCVALPVFSHEMNLPFEEKQADLGSLSQ